MREEERPMRYGTTTTIAVILMALVAVAPLTAGAADTKAQTTTQEGKTMVTDSWVTSKTKISLFADERVKGTQVSVDTTKGVVHLRGKVDSAEAKSAAGDIAKGIDGDIAKAVGTRLSKDTQLKKVDVRTDAGVVTLTGQVPTIGASAKASEMARGVSGVKSVKNELTFTK